MYGWKFRVFFLGLLSLSLTYLKAATPQWDTLNIELTNFSEKTIVASVKFNHEGQKLIFIKPSDETQLFSWGFATETEFGYRPNDLNKMTVLDPFELIRIRESIRNKRISYDIVVGRNQSNIEETKLHPAFKSSAKRYAKIEHLLLSYWYQHIEHHIEETLSQNFYGLIKAFELGRTYENRPIKAYKVSCPQSTPKNNLIWISLEHARERTTVMSNLFAMQDFLKQLSLKPEQYCNTAVWFIPIFNPDGFVYANNHDEMWRKNRRPVFNLDINGDTLRAVGVDIARNFYDPNCPQDFRLENDMPYPDDDSTAHNGLQKLNTFSDDPSSEIYRGTQDSEAETNALTQMIERHPYNFFNSIVTLHAAHENGGIFHIDDAQALGLAQHMHKEINTSGYDYSAYNINNLYNHKIPGIPEFYMYNRNIPMLTVEFALNKSPMCYNFFDPPLDQMIKDSEVASKALFANINYWQR